MLLAMNTVMTSQLTADVIIYFVRLVHIDYRFFASIDSNICIVRI